MGDPDLTKPLDVLVVEPDPHARDELGLLFARWGDRVTSADGREAAVALLDENEFDLIVISSQLDPQSDADELARQARERQRRRPTIVLLGATAAAPAGPGEQAGRVVVLVGHIRGGRRRDVFSLGDLELDPQRGLASVAGRQVELTVVQTALLHRLLQTPGRTVTREAAVRHIWGDMAPRDTSTIDRVITELQHKIEMDPAAPRRLRILPDGYRLDAVP